MPTDQNFQRFFGLIFEGRDIAEFISSNEKLQRNDT